MTRRTRAQRAARLRAIEGVPEGECLAETGNRHTECDCDICGQYSDEENARYLDLEEER